MIFFIYENGVAKFKIEARKLIKIILEFKIPLLSILI
jgi:hypothetical protein